MHWCLINVWNINFFYLLNMKYRVCFLLLFLYSTFQELTVLLYLIWSGHQLPPFEGGGVFLSLMSNKIAYNYCQYETTRSSAFTHGSQQYSDTKDRFLCSFLWFYGLSFSLSLKILLFCTSSDISMGCTCYFYL